MEKDISSKLTALASAAQELARLSRNYVQFLDDNEAQEPELLEELIDQVQAIERSRREIEVLSSEVLKSKNGLQGKPPTQQLHLPNLLFGSLFSGESIYVPQLDFSLEDEGLVVYSLRFKDSGAMLRLGVKVKMRKIPQLSEVDAMLTKPTLSSPIGRIEKIQAIIDLSKLLGEGFSSAISRGNNWYPVESWLLGLSLTEKPDYIERLRKRYSQQDEKEFYAKTAEIRSSVRELQAVGAHIYFL